MSNSQLPSWKEWADLSEDQKEYEHHRVLVNLDNRLQFIEKRKKLDTTFSLAMAAVMGFFGGLVKGFIK